MQMIKPSVEKNVRISNLIDIRKLTNSAFVLRFEKHDLSFTAGQHIALGIPDIIDTREYSIYSAENDESMEVLIKEVEEGFMSPKFGKLVVGQKVKVMKPVGYFTINKDYLQSKRFVFIASGTGIAPFHSIIKSYPDINYSILHGIRTSEEAYERNEYTAGKYIACTSRDKNGDFHGRVTDYLQQNSIDTQAIYYLCGNYEMIDEAYGILEKAGVKPENLKAEVYF
jgi:ferredoxin--NADP+ reductase/benzoate/toluate 1,2-dioxygenase reductase subunit